MTPVAEHVRRLTWSALLLVVAACDTPRPADVIGPYTGESRRFVVDQIYLPTTNAQAKEYGGTLDGNDSIDNQLGLAISSLRSFGDVNEYPDDIINAGVIASSVIVTADDFQNDDTVSVRYLASDDDTTSVEVGGRLIDGVFESNRTRWTNVPGAATVRLPVFPDANPSTVRVEGLELDFAPGRYEGLDLGLHGVIVEDLFAAAYPGIAQMLWGLGRAITTC